MNLSSSRAVAQTGQSTPSKQLLSGGLKPFITYTIMVLLIVIMVLPFAWMLSTSLKSQEYILSATPQWIPNPLTFESYTLLGERINLVRTFLNSVFIAVVGTTGQVLVSAMAAFAFARMQWRGRNTVFILYLATMMIP